MPKVIADVEYANILSLPKDKIALDFIKQKFALKSSPEQIEVIDELFEMHRTSTGFNPGHLSKGRFRRIKVEAFRQILAYVENELPAITNSLEYREYLQKQNRSAVILEKLKLVKSKLERVDYVNIEKELQELKEQISIAETKDLLSAFANLFNPLTKEKKKQPFRQ